MAFAASGRIVETEAYAGVDDRASHAFRRQDERPGQNICTGIRVLYMFISVMACIICFNVITNKKDIPHGVLIRALEPMEGIDHMLKRTGKLTAGFYAYKRSRKSVPRNGYDPNYIPAEIYFPKKFLLKTMDCDTKKNRLSLPKELVWNRRRRRCRTALSVYRKGKSLCECEKILEFRTRNCFSSVSRFFDIDERNFKSTLAF